MGTLSFLIFFYQNIDCGYLKASFFPITFSIFTAEKNLCILHGRVFAIIAIGDKFVDLTLRKLAHAIDRDIFSLLKFFSRGGSNEHPQSMFWSKNKKK